jgi:hypothetical protein
MRSATLLSRNRILHDAYNGFSAYVSRFRYQVFRKGTAFRVCVRTLVLYQGTTLVGP